MVNRAFKYVDIIPQLLRKITEKSAVEKLNTLVAERPEPYVLEACDFIKHCMKLIEDGMILIHFIKCTIKTYTALAENFTIMAAPIMLMARREKWQVIAIAK